MDDRELLELAAKAAGFATIEYQDWELMEIRYGFEKAIWNGHDYWNPIDNDADALRLAIDLQISFWSDGLNIHVNAVKHTVSTAQELYATARRAIVRAAAEIGKQMQHIDSEGGHCD